jgi:hypothetical protein
MTSLHLYGTPTGTVCGITDTTETSPQAQTHRRCAAGAAQSLVRQTAITEGTLLDSVAWAIEFDHKQMVLPGFHNKNLSAEVVGAVVRVSRANSKVRGDGYRERRKVR